ncbi:MAG: hypothetical protein KatS3mg110_0942 [Pirellulaceae bacterium]|nr:MAG: hypothetical protein KatS3mg110_0942 [Pirellulaceae bacterium]
MFDPSKFTVQTTKPLPVFLLLDVSGSMNEVIDPENVRRTGRTVISDGRTWEIVEGGTTKIRVLNDAVRRMIESLTAEERTETQFLVSVIVFGDRALQHLPLIPASAVQWTDMTADGCTAMGAAFSLVKGLIEDRSIVPSRAYRPTVVLVSDGQPTDDWKLPLESLIAEGRSSKCFFMAMGIGENPGMEVLERFISRTPTLMEVNGHAVPNRVFRATDAAKIHEFFQKVTLSVTIRSKSFNPNVPPAITTASEDEGGYW